MPKRIDFDQAVPLIQSLPEYQAIDDEEGRRAAFAKFVKRQKVRVFDNLMFVCLLDLQERLREQSDDGGSNSGRKRKEPAREHRDGERERERSDRQREPERDSQRVRDYDRESRHSRHFQRGHEEYDTSDRRTSRDHNRDRDRDREKGKEHAKEGDKEKELYRSSKHHRESERDDRRRDRKGLHSGNKEWDDTGSRRERSKSISAYHEEGKATKELTYEDKVEEGRIEKVCLWTRLQ